MQNSEERKLWREKYIRIGTEFHTKAAPGLIIGIYMVELALVHLKKPFGKLNAIAESSICLPDSIMVTTHCTVGNKYLHIIDTGRYALILYDRKTREGVRVYVDYNKIDAKTTPTLKKFFDGTREYSQISREQQQTIVLEEFYQVHQDVLSWEPVLVDLPEKPPLPSTCFCEHCKQYYKTFQPGNLCQGCKTSVYQVIS